jgi:hypothetical protein
MVTKKKREFFLVYVVTALFFSGCKFDKKNVVIEDPFLFSVISSVEVVSQDEAKLLGFIFLPFFIEQHVGKKNENFYIVDTFYAASIETFDSSYQLLKNLYIQDGWALIEEAVSNLYINAFFKKQNKEIVVVIQEQEIYNKEKKIKNKKILLHQSLLLL